MSNVELIHGSVKAATVRSVLADAKQIVIISAYTTTAGLAEVRKPILDCIKGGGSVTLLLGLDRTGVTSTEVVRELATMQKKAGDQLKVLLVIEQGRAFLHAKVFAARKARGADVLVGSFNLTGRGLGANHELAARISTGTSTVFGQLGEFVESIPDKQVLTTANAEAVARALHRTPGAPETPEVVAERRRAAKERLDELLAVLHVAKGEVIPRDELSTVLGQLQSSGAFWTYEFDLERLTVPSGLASFYARGLLLREKAAQAGTAKLRLPATVSAGFPLVPPERQRQFSRLAKRLGKAFRACGFETPFGWWIPRAYLDRLQSTANEIARSLPADDVLSAEVRAYIRKHKATLDETTAVIVQYATERGIQHPSRWSDARDEVVASLKARYLDTAVSGWSTSRGHAETLEYIRATLRRVADKLDADLAIAKLHRIRPEMLRVPVEQDDATVRRLLESMTWAVVEDRGTKNTKPAVRELSCARSGAARQPSVLVELSQALLEGVDGAEATFFRVFGSPPYWQTTTDALHLEDDDGEE